MLTNLASDLVYISARLEPKHRALIGRRRGTRVGRGVAMAQLRRPFRGDGSALIPCFEETLPAEGPARFRRLAWEFLFHAIEGAPDWLEKCVAARGYVFRREAR
jgi:hypothetical protein